MKEALLIGIGVCQSLLVWKLLRAKDAIKRLNEENNQLAGMILQMIRSNSNGQ